MMAIPNLSLDDNLRGLSFLFAAERAILRRLGGWMARIPYWDAKLSVGTHIWEDAQHAEALLRRLHELKDIGPERRVSLPIENLLDRATKAKNGDDFLIGIYDCVKPWLIERYEAHLRRADPVMDTPTIAVLKHIIDEKKRQTEWFDSYRPAYSPPIDRSRAAVWAKLIRHALAEYAEGGVTAEESASLCYAEPITLVAERDTCFRTTDRRESLLDPQTFEDRRLAVFWNHAQEMQFAESLGQILYETAEMPWAFHLDLSRHLADEVRHTRMGCTRLEHLNAPLTEYPMLVQNYAMRAKLDPVSRFCLMTLVTEAGAFASKRKNVEMFIANGDHLSAQYESYDIRDEMMHVHFGHVWVPIMLKVYHDSRAVSELVQQCRDIVATASRSVDAGVTEGYS